MNLGKFNALLDYGKWVQFAELVEASKSHKSSCVGESC